MIILILLILILLLIFYFKFNTSSTNKNSLINGTTIEKTRTLFLYKENMTTPDLNHINLSRVEILDNNDKKIKLNLHSYSSKIELDNLKLENMLDGDNETYGSLAFLRKLKYHKWENETYKDSVCKSKINGEINKHCPKNLLLPRWISFTFKTKNPLKKIYIRNPPSSKVKPRDEFEDLNNNGTNMDEWSAAKREAKELDKRIEGLKVLIYDGIVTQKELSKKLPLFMKKITSTNKNHDIDLIEDNELNQTST